METTNKIFFTLGTHMSGKPVKNKLTPKQEKFAQKYVECSNASEAYRQAYDTENMSDKVIWNEACILTGNRGVAVMIEEIRKQLADKTMVTLEKLNGRNEQIWHLSSGRNADGSDKDEEFRRIDITAMQKNVESQAKLNGLIIDKTENKNLNTDETLAEYNKRCAEGLKDKHDNN